MTTLYLSAIQDQAQGALAKLRADVGHGQLVRDRFGQTIIAFDEPGDEILFKGFQLISQDAIKSAVLVSQPLSSDELWIAGEFWGKFLADPDCAHRIDIFAARSARELRVADRNMLIFEAARADAATFNGRASGLLGTRQVSARAVLENPSAIYGVFADPAIGGANALFAAGQEAMKLHYDQGPIIVRDQVLVGAPEAFGFVEDTGEASTVAWQRKSVIAIEAIGFGLGDWSAALGLLAKHDVAEAFHGHREQFSEWNARDCRFGLAIVLRGIEDPPVVIPAGAVFQQPHMGSGDQNLAAAKAASVFVAAGATVPVILPAYCLNPTFSPPSGPMMPTALVYPSLGQSQSEVWNGIRRRYGVQP